MKIRDFEILIRISCVSFRSVIGSHVDVVFRQTIWWLREEI